MARVHKQHKSIYKMLPIIIVILVLILLPKGFIGKFIKFIFSKIIYILLVVCIIAFARYKLSGKAAEEDRELEENKIALERQRQEDKEKIKQKVDEVTGKIKTKKVDTVTEQAEDPAKDTMSYFN